MEIPPTACCQIEVCNSLKNLIMILKHRGYTEGAKHMYYCAAYFYDLSV